MGEEGCNKDRIEQKTEELLGKFKNILHIDNNLTRQMVSFQANKKVPYYRWYKYKEGFSADLVNYYLTRYSVKHGHVLDPFAGIGTTLFASVERELQATGIELLPIGVEVMEARKVLLSLSDEEFSHIEDFVKQRKWTIVEGKNQLESLTITEGAYPPETKEWIEKYLFAASHEGKEIERVLIFALICVLESISYTRKDGQYLRWDYRAGRRPYKKEFNKGKILTFEQAIIEKWDEIFEDTYYAKRMSLFNDVEMSRISKDNPKILMGSSLELLKNFDKESVDCIITSPPYANRYDYTRTYALELSLLGINNDELSKLRQNMVSCTVENKEKNLLEINPEWIKVINILNNQDLLQDIIEYLEQKKINKELNNNGIPRMVKGYFYELSCIIYESYRVLKTGSRLIMVNDNVRYAGIEIPVDLILSNIAEAIGFKVEEISVLPIGKGNSSQQMGSYGRNELRKCVYIWQK